MARPITVPRAVTLPVSSHIWPGDCYARLNISRQTAHVWRRHGFPQSAPSVGLDTAAVAAWLAERGASIQWI